MIDWPGAYPFDKISAAEHGFQRFSPSFLIFFFHLHEGILEADNITQVLVISFFQPFCLFLDLAVLFLPLLIFFLFLEMGNRKWV